MRILVENDYIAMSKKAAGIMADQIRSKPDSVIGLATGGTPEGTYAELVRLHREETLDFSGVATFNLDEYLGLRADDPRSYRFFMEERLFKSVNLNPSNIHFLDGLAKDVGAECRRYEQSIRNAGGIDLQLLGIGRNGHIGFNEPDVKFESLTHLVRLDRTTVRDNKRFFHSAGEVPRYALSMGVKTIMLAKNILLLASGAAKADIVRRAVSGGITPQVTASILQLHGSVTLVLDKDAAAGL